MAGTQSHQENMLIEVKQLLCLGLRPFRSQFLSKSHYAPDRMLKHLTYPKLITAGEFSHYSASVMGEKLSEICLIT